jgi:hypothetical protein
MNETTMTIETRVERAASRGSVRLPGRTAACVARVLALGLTALALTACERDVAEPPAPAWERVEITSPAGEGASIPNLFTAADGQIYMNWYEPRGEEGHVLRFSALAPEVVEWEGSPVGAAVWTEPRTIVESEDFFVNWADFPSMFAFSHGLMAAHWPIRSGPGTYDYDVHIAWSEDAGRSWSDPVIPHRDGTQSEHGFVSLFPWDDGSLAAIWLDGRKYPRQPDDPEMTLQFTTLTPTELGPEVELDGRVCECCQTSAALTDEGPVVVYRDRSDDEIRDISIIRFGPEGWSEPAPVHRDGWEIHACPVNGPMVDARGRRVAVAWFTAADDDPRVRLAFSDDAGRSFGPPVGVDDGNPVGRVAVVLRPDGGAWVSWLERVGSGAEVRVRGVEPDGTVTSASTTVAASSAERASGFPRMASVGDALVFAWTETEGEGTVRVAMLRPEEVR